MPKQSPTIKLLANERKFLIKILEKELEVHEKANVHTQEFLDKKNGDKYFEKSYHEKMIKITNKKIEMIKHIIGKLTGEIWL